jgi:hypothetical protein
MIQGSLVETYRTCGREGCRCRRGGKFRHGPHAYLTFRGADGRSAAIFVPEAEQAAVREGVEAWKRFWTLAGEIAGRNRDTVATKWRATARGTRTKETKETKQ